VIPGLGTDFRVHHNSRFRSSTAGSSTAALSILAVVPLFVWAVSLAAQNPRQHGKEQPQTSAEGRKTFESVCAGCHGLDGRGGERGPDIVGRLEIQRLSDAETLEILKNGKPAKGMPAFGSLGNMKLEKLLSHFRTLQGKGNATAFRGDPQKGQTLFFGKARCSECHMVHGTGGFLGSDLSTYGRALSAAEVRSVIVSPDRDLDQRRRVLAVTGRNGQKYSGLARNEDNFSIQLQALDGTFYLLAKSEIEHVEFLPTALMPADYGSTLNPNEIDDLVGYLVRIAKSEPTTRARKSKWQEDE
jgi:putative heme-binding domain-containing protein